MLDKLLEACIETNISGTLQEQAKKLCEKEKIYKKLIVEYSRQIAEAEDDVLIEELELMLYKYETRLDYVKQETCLLNKRIIDTLKAIEDIVEIEIIMEKFGLEYEAYDETEDIYNNLIASATDIGHVCRLGLIYSEKLAKEMLEEGY